MIKVLYLDVIVEKFRFVIIVFSLTHRLCVDIFHNAISNIFLRQKGLFSDRLLALLQITIALQGTIGRACQGVIKRVEQR
jgi:hypothetical protein